MIGGDYFETPCTECGVLPLVVDHLTKHITNGCQCDPDFAPTTLQLYDFLSAELDRHDDPANWIPNEDERPAALKGARLLPSPDGTKYLLEDPSPTRWERFRAWLPKWLGGMPLESWLIDCNWRAQFLPERYFQCAECDGIWRKARTDAEAIAEAIDEHGAAMLAAGAACVCDDCHNDIIGDA